MGYIKYWNLRDKPFEELGDTRFFFESDDHREALDRMLYVVNDRSMNMGLLTGEVGSGKTITKNVVCSSLPRHDFEVISFENSNFSFSDLLFDICRRITFRDARIGLSASFDAPRRGDSFMLMALFKKIVETLVYEDKRHLVLIFDEAQQIESKVLDEIKNLTNISSETQTYLTIFLIGQPELRENIRILRQVDQRIFLRFHLNNLDFNNTCKYIQHRLRIAGSIHAGPFTSSAFEAIFRATGGIPREINRLCKLALNYGFAQNLSELSHEDVAVIIDDLRTNA